MAGRPETGSLVELRGERWLLTRTQPFKSCTLLCLEGRDRSNAAQRLQVIDPFDRPRIITPASLVRRRRAVVLAQALAMIRDAHPVAGLWTAAAAHIDLHAYQLEPALAALNGATRLLLADAVGLGKTIQAGLLVSELHQRGWIARALIVCPAGMRETWQRELRERFGLTAAILDQQAITDRVAAFPPGINPWTVDSMAIVSVDFLKRQEVMAALDGVPIDLLIVDEAHHVSAGTDRGAAVAALAARSPWCVLVSATPHSGERDAFDDLVRLGGHGEDIRVFRRTRADIGLPHERRTRFLKVQLEPRERALMDAIARYSRAIWLARGQVDHAARLVAITLARRACSSIAAIERTLRRRRELIGSTVDDSAQPHLPWDDVDDSDGDDRDAIVAAPGLDDINDERRTLDELIVLAASHPGGSKMRRLQRLLSRIGEAAIVFTEYRDTLDALSIALGRRYRVVAIHGGMSREARTSAVDHFNAGLFDVMVATDAAGEGLNLQHRCRLVIDFELPWNPLRLEQRVGRVDRIGQRKVVHAIRFFHGDTIEQEVLERLSLRQQRADEDLERAASEREIAEAVLMGTEMVPVTRRLARCRISETSQSEVTRLQELRSAKRYDVTPLRCWAAPKRRSTRNFTALVRHTFTNAHGIVRGRRLHAIEARFCRAPRSRREWREAIDSLRAAIVVEPLQLPADALIARRVAAIRAHLRRKERREFQRSLFDRRAEDAESARAEDAARLEAALARLEQAVAPADMARTLADVVAAWPGRRA